MTKSSSDDEKTMEQLNEELAQLRKRISQLETAQDLGWVPNLSYFNERLEEEISRGTRYKYEFSIIVLQLDNLNTYIKKYGNQAGNEIVGMMQTILRNSVRSPDMYCRFENSKFGLILPYTDGNGAFIVSERIRQTTERVLSLKSTTVNISLTVSAGIAVFPVDAAFSKLLIDRGDAALLFAQRRGGNNSCLAGESRVAATISRSTLLEYAAANDTFTNLLGDEIQRSARYGAEFSLLLLNFTPTDLEERKAGRSDLVWMMPDVSQFISRNIRAVDKCFPYAYGRFVVMLPNTGSGNAQILAQKLLRAFTEPADDNAAKKIRQVFSIGIASFPTDEVTIEGLIKCAEAALDLAVQRGSNQLALASGMVTGDGSNLRNITAWIEILKGTAQNSIYNLLALLDATEHYTTPHSQNVSRYAVAIAKGLGLTTADTRKLRVTALLHDIGKVSISPALITKAGQLDPDEWDIMRKHPEFGAAIVERFPDFAFCSETILTHHERIDGKGYPKGLTGNQIPLNARIIAVAEAFDDMVTSRPYREQLSQARALAELKRNTDSQFDVSVVAALKKTLTSAASR